jgi:calmodulin
LVAILGSGCIEFPEFIELMAKKMLVLDEEDQIREAFKVFDPRGVGYITAKELKRIMMNYGDKLSEEEADELLAEADLDHNGLIECEGQ